MQITLKHLKKTYASKKSGGDGGSPIVTAVNNISLSIPDNKIFGIIGKSGAGKSSLVRLVSLLETPDQGAVYYGDRRVDDLGKNDLILQRRKIGMIFQNFNLFSSRTAGKNIAYPLEICGTPKAQIAERVKKMLSLVGLSDRENAPISTLSGGQKQRIAIARALATEPDILFCDEATSALDPQTTRSILDLIRQIQKQMNLTVVMITHQMEVVRDACDLVAVIDNGRIVEQGTVSEIFSNPQTSITREFLKNLRPGDNGRDGRNIVRWADDGGHYVLHFIGDNPGKPILSQIAKKFDIEFNILAAGIERIVEGEVGSMLVDFFGEQAEIEKAIAYLESIGVRVSLAKSGE
ncbi:MAG: methionine ABC transporter ATP-binding protein [Treponema sp.]|nr:methionine ABC transporter ATP-binding protein [Treponema sp.]